jgi:hypothetical protein
VNFPELTSVTNSCQPARPDASGGPLACRPLPPYAFDAERRAMSTAARPSTISASGIGHHQCSPNAASPWALSRPAQKTPRSRRTAPTIWPIRRMVTRYYLRRRSCECAGTVVRKLSPSPRSNLTDLRVKLLDTASSHQNRSMSAVIRWGPLGDHTPCTEPNNPQVATPHADLAECR